MNTKNKTKEGFCALTDTFGKLVKCHILPQAFTRPAIKGEALYQSTRAAGERRRWSSWYDPNLVTRTGEDLLSAIDNAAIKTLRRYQLVWSSWLVFRPHFETMAPMLPDHGYRDISIADTDALIRFALSIAWRASASSLSDMKEATLEKRQEEQLKEFVLGRSIIGASPFPVSITQISTIGERHNQSPSIDEKTIVGFEGAADRFVKIMRIYLDGLIFHVHLSPMNDGDLKGNPIFLGSSDHTLVTSVTYEASYQYENMLHLMRECHPLLIERD